MVMLFIMLNQIFQSELVIIDIRSSDFLNVNYKNTSFIWGTSDDNIIGNFLLKLCPDIFKTVPFGIYKGEFKCWPWFWLIIPIYILLLPSSFLISLIFDFKGFINDLKKLFYRRV